MSLDKSLDMSSDLRPSVKALFRGAFFVHLPARDRVRLLGA